MSYSTMIPDLQRAVLSTTGELAVSEIAAV